MQIITPGETHCHPLWIINRRVDENRQIFILRRSLNDISCSRWAEKLCKVIVVINPHILIRCKNEENVFAYNQLLPVQILAVSRLILLDPIADTDSQKKWHRRAVHWQTTSNYGSFNLFAQETLSLDGVTKNRTSNDLSNNFHPRPSMYIFIFMPFYKRGALR